MDICFPLYWVTAKKCIFKRTPKIILNEVNINKVSFPEICIIRMFVN